MPVTGPGTNIVPIDWFEPVRAYCERGSGAFWAEPFGAASNAAFLVAAAAAAWRARAARDTAALAFACLIAVIGLGSFLFHTLAVRWALLADVVPIALFVVAYFGLALRRFLGLPAVAAILGSLAFAALDVGLGPAVDAVFGARLSDLTNGSLDYLPAALALVGVAAALPFTPRGGPAAVRRATARRLLGTAGLFLLSLTFRTLDRAVCATIPIGTHWLWHVLNAAVLYGLVAAAVRHRSAVVAGAPETLQKGAPRGSSVARTPSRSG